MLNYLQNLRRAVARGAWVLAFCVSSLAHADGWHGAAMSTRSLDDWLTEVKRAVPDLDKRLVSSELKSGVNSEDLGRTPGVGRAPIGGGRVQDNFTPEQRVMLARKAQDCLDVLAYMDPKNINPNEFPQFPMDKIPLYRKTAKQLLGAMGAQGSSAVVGRIRAELMGQVQAFDVTPHQNFGSDLLESLAAAVKSGGVSERDIEDLLQAAAGAKTPGGAAVANKAVEILLENAPPGQLLRAASATSDKKLKARLLAYVQAKVAAAGVRDLLDIMNSADDPATMRFAAQELAKRSPTYKELKPDIDGLWQLSRSDKKQVAEVAREHVEVAFQRAPIPECLSWLGENQDAELDKLIWAQIDARAARADESRLSDYRTAAATVLHDAQAALDTRDAALALLARLPSREVASRLIDALDTLPRELWPKAGDLLRKSTGQKFGPKAGDGRAEVLVEQKKWKIWWKDNGGK